MIFLWLLFTVLLVGIMIFFAVKRSKAKQQKLQKVETEEVLPKLKFED